MSCLLDEPDEANCHDHKILTNKELLASNPSFVRDSDCSSGSDLFISKEDELLQTMLVTENNCSGYVRDNIEPKIGIPKFHIGERKSYPYPVKRVEKCKGVIHCSFKKTICYFKSKDGNETEIEFIDIMDLCSIRGLSDIESGIVDESPVPLPGKSELLQPLQSDKIDIVISPANRTPKHEALKSVDPRNQILVPKPSSSSTHSMATRKRKYVYHSSFESDCSGREEKNVTSKKRGRPKKYSKMNSAKYQPFAGEIEKCSPVKTVEDRTGMFRNQAFVFTEVVDMEKEIRKESQLYQYFHNLQSSWSSSSESEELTQSLCDSLPPAHGYDKRQLLNCVLAEGGKVFDSIQELKKFSGKKCLISNGVCRTEKFIRAIAANIPCVYFKWISDSLHQGKSVNMMSYMLPVGLGIEHLDIINSRKCRYPFRETSLYLDLEDKLYEDIAVDAGAIIVHEIAMAQFVVTGVSCPMTIVSLANCLRIPLVSVTWLVQCIIRGEVINDGFHVRYSYNVNEPSLS